MDLSNKDEAKYWFEQARKEEDPELRKIATDACKHYQKLSIDQSKLDAKRSKPGYGFRPLLGFFCLTAVLVVCSLLAVTKTFSVGGLLTTGGIALGLMVVGSAFTLRATGHLSDDSLIKLVQIGVQIVTNQKGNSQIIPTIEGQVGSSANKNAALPSGDKPALPLDNDLES